MLSLTPGQEYTGFAAPVPCPCVVVVVNDQLAAFFYGKEVAMLDPIFGALALVAILGVILASLTAMVLGSGPQVVQELVKALIEIFRNLR